MRCSTKKSKYIYAPTQSMGARKVYKVNDNLYFFSFISEYNIRYSKDAREILELLPYTPKPTLEHIKTALRRLKQEHEALTKSL